MGSGFQVPKNPLSSDEHSNKECGAAAPFPPYSSSFKGHRLLIYDHLLRLTNTIYNIYDRNASTHKKWKHMQLL